MSPELYWITRKEISLFPEEQRKRISKRRKTIDEKLMVILAPCHFTTRKSCSFSTFFSFSSFGWLFHWRIVGRWQVKPSCARKVMQEDWKRSIRPDIIVPLLIDFCGVPFARIQPPTCLLTLTKLICFTLVFCNKR